MFSIRKAQISDACVLAEIGGRTFYDTFRPYNTEEDMQAYISKAYNTQTISLNFENPDIAYYLCLDEETVAGYIKLIANTSIGEAEEKAIELEKIYVMHEYFGSEAGQLLMNTAIEHTMQHGFNSIFLGVWKENKRAVRFYEKNGFAVFAERSFQLGSRLCEDFMMKKNID